MRVGNISCWRTLLFGRKHRTLLRTVMFSRYQQMEIFINNIPLKGGNYVYCGRTGMGDP
jgi:hypothetical protein